ncbi:hypothetical protein WDV85_14470 [Pseudokineococcus sp. 5B2Z-1]|uniref:hypothetical protein n=1 Tax=Pseudokineococcus sp. 5B2Z-1 TaxID=3132744 RepID=UPI00309C7FD0
MGRPARRALGAALAVVGVMSVATCAGQEVPAGFPEADALPIEVEQLGRGVGPGDLGDCPPDGEVLSEPSFITGDDVEYVGESAVVTVGVYEVRTSGPREAVGRLAASPGPCTRADFEVQRDEASEMVVADAVDVERGAVVVLRAATGGLGPGAEVSQGYHRAAVDLGDGRLVVVTVATSSEIVETGLVAATGAAVEAARGVDGLPDADALEQVPPGVR